MLDFFLCDTLQGTDWTIFSLLFSDVCFVQFYFNFSLGKYLRILKKYQT